MSVNEGYEYEEIYIKSVREKLRVVRFIIFIFELLD